MKLRYCVIRSLTVLIFVLISQSALAQLFYTSEDTLWMWSSQETDAAFIAEGDIEGIAVDTASGVVYWSQYADFDSEIKRANLDGSDVEVLYEETPSARGVALDPVNSYLYWVDLQNNGEVLRADLADFNVESLVAGEEEGVTDGVLDIALDTENEKIYWTTRGAIMRADLDGSNVETFVEISAFVQPTGIAVNTRDGHVYWVDTSSDNIVRADIDTGESEDLITDADEPQGLALDLDGNKIYWTSDYFMTGEGGAISRANLDGSDVELLFNTGFTRGPIYVAGFEMPTSSETNPDLPNAVKLLNNYPNPFNPQTTIRYNLPEAMAVTIEVYNFLGQKVQTIMQSEIQAAGSHQVQFDASDLPSGTYMYRLQTAAGDETRRMTLIK